MLIFSQLMSASLGFVTIQIRHIDIVLFEQQVC